MTTTGTRTAEAGRIARAAAVVVALDFPLEDGQRRAALARLHLLGVSEERAAILLDLGEHRAALADGRESPVPPHQRGGVSPQTQRFLAVTAALESLIPGWPFPAVDLPTAVRGLAPIDAARARMLLAELQNAPPADEWN